MTLEIGDPEAPTRSRRAAGRRRFGIRDEGRPADGWLRETARWAWKVKLLSHLETELKQRMREAAEEEAIRVFASNLRDLLLAAPAGPRPTLGLDPGTTHRRQGGGGGRHRQTGGYRDHLSPCPAQPVGCESLHALAELCRRHHELLSIGNGTASRETDRLATELMQRHPELRLQNWWCRKPALRSIPPRNWRRGVSRSGRVLRGAVSIARRLQDPLAELVKIEPKAIGVGQYQHDVGQTRLARTLDAVVEDCVNAVGWT